MLKITQLKDELSKTVINRDDLIEGLLLGLLSGQHVLFVGPPGTAKSMLVNELGSRLSGGRYFSYLMTKFTKPDEIIGAVSLKSLEKDEFRRVLTGKIADAHFVFLDEIFNSNSSCANTILTILNERRFHNGTEVIEVPLVMMVGATNEIPAETEDELQAFYDRFLFRYEVEYIKGAENLRRLFELPAQNSKSTLYTLEELYNWQCEAGQIEVPDDIVNKVISVVLKLREAGVKISDRRFRESRKALQAHAYLNGRSKVGIPDLHVLEDIFWIKPADRRILADVLFSVKLTVEVRAAELLKEAQQIKGSFEALDDRLRRKVLGGEMNVRLTEIEEQLAEMMELAGGPNAVLNDALKKVRDIQAAIVKDCLGMDARSV